MSHRCSPIRTVHTIITRIHHLTNIRLLPTLGVFALVMAAAYMFPSTTHAALPANELWREQLLNQRVGFGRNATGGAGGTLCTVSNLNDSGAGSLRACLTASGPQWIIFSVSGTITLSSQIHMRGALGNNDKTIDGRGQNITINGGSSLHTILLNDVHNWIIHNVNLTTNPSTGQFILRLLSGTNNIWIDHISITGAASNIASLGIGAVAGDNSLPSTNITISWSRFYNLGVGSGFILISANNNTDSPMVGSSITLHHNWYNQGFVRHPLMRFAKVHSFNNFFDNNPIGAQVREHGRFYSETR